MNIDPFLDFSQREELRAWLEEHHTSARCCWVPCNRSKTPRKNAMPYLDVVEEALCFGWIDSTCKKMPDGRLAQRLSPRRKGSRWTELNQQRYADLERCGLMTDAGRKALAAFLIFQS